MPLPELFSLGRLGSDGVCQHEHHHAPKDPTDHGLHDRSRSVPISVPTRMHLRPEEEHPQGTNPPGRRTMSASPNRMSARAVVVTATIVLVLVLAAASVIGAGAELRTRARTTEISLKSSPCPPPLLRSPSRPSTRSGAPAHSDRARLALDTSGPLPSTTRSQP